jgi:DNA-binding NtrC family response regulator
MGSSELVGTSAAMAALRPEIERAARSDAKVLITGESGVGKEIVARRLHEGSRRGRSSLLAINCAGMPETLLESELFGHAKGSFTGAYRDKPGLLQLAHRGTIFLDEVGETTPRMQSLLLRFLETGEIQRVGSTVRDAQVDVRVIAATNRNLQEAVSAGEFRRDFFYRLNVIHVHVPPLRARIDDIPLLLEHFTKSACLRAGLPPLTYSADATAALQTYHWPGNVRELQNVVERLSVRIRGAIVQLADLPVEIQRSAVEGVSIRPAALTRADVVNSMFERITRRHESFWSVAYAPFMLRDLMREDIRALVERGLEEAGGDHDMLTKVFNMDQADYRRLLNFLRKHQCHGPLRLTAGERTRMP